MENELNIAREIFSKINEVRTNPIKIANKIAFMMSYINKRDNTLREPKKPSYKLIEGIRAYEEAITFLKSFEPVEELVWEDFVSKVSQEQAAEISKKSLNMYESKEINIKYEDRFRKFGNFSNLQEILVYSDSDALRVATELIICDGDNSRTNRNFILSQNFRQIGVGVESHSKLGNVCVIYLARNFRFRNESCLNNTVLKNKDEKKLLSIANSDGIENSVIGKPSDIDYRESYDEIVSKYQNELEDDLEFDEYLHKNVEKQFILEGQTLKIIKKIKYDFLDKNPRTVFLSKTIRLHKANC